MLVPDITITDEDIEYAEKILLKEGQNFDDELGQRKEFIKDLSTLDLQAVPGSGKTTALLAKLLILEKYLPFDDGSGIVVISHTNTAIDEIKNRIEKYCPKLFTYPNFFGTIQSFINKFLVIPFYQIIFEKKLEFIDTEKYEKNIIREFNKISFQDPSRIRGWLWNKQKKDNNKVDEYIKKLYLDLANEDIREIDTEKVLLKDKENEKFKKIYTLLLSSLSKGIISYEYSYKLADYYLQRFPAIAELMRKRFPLVFIDEMQDMDKHQYELLEEIFFNNESITIFQRIGDRNQAIFNGEIKTDEIWKNREKILKLSGTNRLSKPIAAFVQNFGLEFTEINALQNHCEDLKPHIYLYDDSSIEEVIPTYSKLLKKYMDEGKIPSDSKEPFKAVAWRKEHDSQIALKSYYKAFEENSHKTKETYNCLKSYLIFYKDKNSFKDVQNNLLNAFLEVLRLENVKDDNECYYSKSKLKRFLQEKDSKVYDEFNLKIFQWSRSLLAKEDINEVRTEIKEYLNNFITIFGATINKSKSFIEDREIALPSPKSDEKEKINIYDEDGFDIHISTVHSVKGETHTAILYLESCYQKSFESQKLLEQFNFNVFNDSRKYHQQSVKMAYVGFSRPTHLLCVAIHKDRFNESISRENFEIIEIGAN